MGEDGVRSLPEHLKEAENRQAASVSGAAYRVVMNEWPDLLFGLFLLGSGFGGLGCRFAALAGFSAGHSLTEFQDQSHLSTFMAQAVRSATEASRSSL